MGIQRNFVLCGHSLRAGAGLIPLFWYALITLGIPLINAAYSKNGFRFIEHGGMIICGCLMVIAALSLIQSGWQGIKKLITR
jgi:hypothetical protein